MRSLLPNIFLSSEDGFLNGRGFCASETEFVDDRVVFSTIPRMVASFLRRSASRQIGPSHTLSYSFLRCWTRWLHVFKLSMGQWKLRLWRRENSYEMWTKIIISTSETTGNVWSLDYPTTVQTNTLHSPGSTISSQSRDLQSRTLLNLFQCC